MAFVLLNAVNNGDIGFSAMDYFNTPLAFLLDNIRHNFYALICR
jgi:hypothetical protein